MPAPEPLTLEGLADWQARDVLARPRPTLRELRDDGRFDVEELRVPGRDRRAEVTRSNATAWHALLGDRHGAADVSPYVAPARAADLTGLPPAYVEVGSAETFRDEAVAYADAIWRAGGAAELHVWPGAFHGFDTLAPQAVLSQDAREARCRWLRRVIAR